MALVVGAGALLLTASVVAIGIRAAAGFKSTVTVRHRPSAIKSLGEMITS